MVAFVDAGDMSSTIKAEDPKGSNVDSNSPGISRCYSSRPGAGLGRPLDDFVRPLRRQLLGVGRHEDHEPPGNWAELKKKMFRDENTSILFLPICLVKISLTV